MLRIKAAKTKGAYGIGMFMPRMERISNVTTIAIVENIFFHFSSLSVYFFFILIMANISSDLLICLNGENCTSLLLTTGNICLRDFKITTRYLINMSDDF